MKHPAKPSDDRISREYSRALDSGAKTVVANTGGAKFADYSAADLAALPEGAQAHSFGCGNPLAFSDVKPGDTVLDLGCGAGLDLLIAAERVGSTGRVIGVDCNPDMLALAARRTQHHTNVELRQGHIEELPVAPNSVDWVISNCVINLSPAKQRAFDEIARALKPGGRMLVSDIVADKLPWWVRYSGVMRAACGGGVISEGQYLRGLRAAGLDNPGVVARHHYSAEQLASIVVEAAPERLQQLRCCGRRLLQVLLTIFAKPVSDKLWSAKIQASLP